MDSGGNDLKHQNEEDRFILKRLRKLGDKCFKVTWYKAWECVKEYGNTWDMVQREILPELTLAIDEDAPEL